MSVFADLGLNCLQILSADYKIAIMVCFRCTAISGPGPYRRPTGAGLLLLSKTPLSSPLYVDFHPGTQEIFERGYVQAEVQF